ncbi:MAG: efflux RND transporter periplasmic adaptor subunit [Gemmatimonadetes bacterium]|nr:efflux RND transporter periplasmic adaptor subunit [Gemmatimonadota bacterium]
MNENPSAASRPGGSRLRRPRYVAVGMLALVAAWIVVRREPVPARPAARAVPTPDSTITLDSATQRLAGIELFTARAGGDNALIANGTITYDANRVSVVASHVAGRLLTVRADLGQAVRPGALLATLESPEVGAIRGDLERARSGVDIARRNYEREQRLFEQQITPQKELLEAEAAFRTAEADLRSASARLSAIGATDAGGGQGATFGLASPIAGVVVERNASPGQPVGPTSNLFTVADLRNVWITVDVYENDLARVRRGAMAFVTPSAFSSERFPGRVTYAGGVVDTASRTFKVRVEVTNPELRLRPGMFAQVRIPTTDTSPTGGPIAIPEIAVQELNGKQVVFVAGAVAGRFVVRPVTLGPRRGGTVVVASGLAAGERIVVQGAFRIKAELMKASFGEGG